MFYRRNEADPSRTHMMGGAGPAARTAREEDGWI